MDKTVESGAPDIIDLGAVSVETKGVPSGANEIFLQQQPAGLSDD